MLTIKSHVYTKPSTDVNAKHLFLQNHPRMGRQNISFCKTIRGWFRKTLAFAKPSADDKTISLFSRNHPQMIIQNNCINENIHVWYNISNKKNNINFKILSI